MLSIIGKAQTNYYVSTTGNNANSGLTEANAWRTINYILSASSPVMAGDTVFVKAGNYGNEVVIFEKSGTASDPIVIEGYQVIPGDNPNLNYSYGDNLDASVMPLIDGGDRANAEGININGAANISIRNFQITNCEYGIMTESFTSTNLILDNIIVMSIGDINASYSGLGIGMSYTDNNILSNCIVVNSCAEGISLVGNNNLIDNCKVYCDEDMTTEASTDYYLVAKGNNNIFRDCYVERVGDLEHVGHGMGLKEDSENNLFENCIAKNFKGGCFYVRYRGVKYNEFNNCKAIGTQDDVLGFLVRDGASYNVFNNCLSDNCTSGIRFADTDEDGGAQYCGRYNTFNNCIINKPIWAIEFNDYSVASPADNNLFANCVFYEGTYLFETLRENYENKMLNCIVSNFQTLNTGAEPLQFEFSYSDFHNNGFATPIGTSNISDNPLYVDATTGNFHLQDTSPCIDAGTTTHAPIFDFEGTSRPQGSGFDMGAYEYAGTTGLFQNNMSEFLIYPNPTTENIYITNQFINLKYEIFSITGTLVKNGKLDSNIVHLSELKPGVYFMKILGNKHKNTKIVKLIKE